MKIKITSLFLIISLILSLFTMYSFAEEEISTLSDTKSGYTTPYLHYKNTFGDDSDDVGGNRELANSVESTFEVKSESDGNKYGYYNFNDSNKNVFMEFCPNETYNIGSDKLGYLIFELDFNDFGNSLNTSKLLDVNSGKGSFAPAGGRVCASDILNVANDSGGNYFYFCGDKSDKIYIESNEWVHIRCEFSVLSTEADKYNLRCYIDDEYFASAFTMGTPQLIYQIRLGSTNSTNQIFGLDNITIYSTPDIEQAPTGNLLLMKVGAENASVDGVQFELSHAPLLINGQVYCPVTTIEEFTKSECPDGYSILFDETEYIHIDSIKAAFGIAAKSYDMGLILVGDEYSFLDDNATYSDITALMKNFVFNIPTANELKNDVASYTNGYDHPYLLADADRFTELRNIYKDGNSGKLTDSEDLILYDYIKRYLKSAASNLNTYCGISESGTYNGIKSDKIPVNSNYSNYSNNGYDNGGRVTIPTTPLLYFAFAYQITGNLNYARAAYDFMLYLGAWNHWGPDHFLNCADTAAPFAIAYDWMYDAFVELNTKGEKSKYDGEIVDKSKLATILFTHVIIPGYVQSNNLTCPWPGTANSRYSTKTSNWNAVCTSGVVAAALMLLEEDVSTAGMTFNTQKKSGSTFTQTVTPIEEIGKASIHVGLNTYSDYAAKLTSMNLATLAQYGLDQYVPDGSYIESPSYWSYGTNALFRLIASLLSATGDDYGFMDAWGIDTTCYFAVHSESPDYKTWNFNDGSVGMQDSSFFFFVGNYYGDDNLIRVRKKHLNNGKTYSLYDILFYNTSIVGEPELTTEYNMVGIDAFSVRSSWDKGAIYAGIMGGQNNCSHGQMDAGAFIYHNKGKIWFTDLGADKYNIRYTNSAGQNKGYFSNYELYRVGAEGHNILLLTNEQSTLPYGQLQTASPSIIESYSGYDGGYAVLDMSDAYGTHVTNAKRGMLFTSSRNTVVIQDEYVFNGPKTAYWLGHYQLSTGYVDEVLISADGRTAFMISGEDIMRVSIVSDNEDLKFEIMDCYTYLLDKTHRTDRNTMDTDTTETNRDNLRKLAIKCENVTELNLAVVIEEVDNYEFGSSYSYTSISNWRVESKETSIIDTKFKADFDNNSITVGSYHLKKNDNSFELEQIDSSLHSYLGILSKNSSTDNNSLTLHFKNNTSLHLKDYRYVTFDADVFTEGVFIDNATFGINIVKDDGTSNYISLFKFSGNKLIFSDSIVTLNKSFKHITAIIDIENSFIKLYIDNEYITTVNNVISGRIINFEFILPSTSISSAILLDNLHVRTFANTYDNTEISELIDQDASIASWDDAIEYQTISIPLAKANSVNLYTNAEIEDAIKSGNDVTLLRDTTGLIQIHNAVKIITNGFEFKYVSDNYFANESNNEIRFTTGNLTVKWHIGNEIITEVYNGADIATFKGTSNKIGKITAKKTEYDSGVIYELYTTGWAKVQGGNALSPEDMVVSSNNCEFWLVSNVPVNCLFAKIDSNGNVTQYNNAKYLRDLLIANDTSYDVVLFSDVELVDEATISMATKGKNLYLNNHTLSHVQYTSHAYNFNNGSTADFNIIGPGTLSYEGTLTLFTSYSSTSVTTSNFGIVAKNTNIITNNQLADLRIGQHKFINCNIYQNNASRVLIALWNKNLSFGSGGVPANLLTVTFENCAVRSIGGFVSYSNATFSEVYVKDTLITTDSYLIDAKGSLRFVASGKSSIIASRLFSANPFSYNSVRFDEGVATNLEIPTTYLNSGAVLTNNYDSALPYLISANYAKVTWLTLEGEEIVSELVAVGTTPRLTSEDVLQYIKNFAPGYTYNTEVITDTSEVVLTPILKTSLPILYSMTIENDLIMYLYIQKSEMDNSIQSVRVDGTRIMKNSYELVEMDGISYYKYNILSFAPSKASKQIEIVVEYSDGMVKAISTSAVEYLKEVLAISDSDDEKILVIKLLKYIQSAHAYFSSSSESECEMIQQIIDNYSEYDLIFGSLNKENVASGVIRDVIKSACFNLSASVRIRFYLNPEYTGEFSILFDGVINSYSVKNGIVNNCNYIEVIMPAQLINESLILSDGVNTTPYGLGAYAAAMNNTDHKLLEMLIALSEYSSASKKFING